MQFGVSRRFAEPRGSANYRDTLDLDTRLGDKPSLAVMAAAGREDSFKTPAPTRVM